MADGRLERLRETVARLERMPASEERDRLLAEVRSRIVDVDTGFTPQPMRVVEPEPPDEPEPPARVPPAKPKPPAVAPAPPPQPAPRPAADDPLETGAARLSLEETGEGDDPEDPGAWRKGLRG